MKNKSTKKPNLVTLSLEELKSVTGGAVTLDEQACKSSVAAPEQYLKQNKSSEQKVKF